MMLGALEAGGTKMVCALGNELGDIFERVSFPTRMPEETMRDVAGSRACVPPAARRANNNGPAGPRCSLACRYDFPDRW